MLIYISLTTHEEPHNLRYLLEFQSWIYIRWHHICSILLKDLARRRWKLIGQCRLLLCHAYKNPGRDELNPGCQANRSSRSCQVLLCNHKRGERNVHGLSLRTEQDTGEMTADWLQWTGRLTTNKRWKCTTNCCSCE